MFLRHTIKNSIENNSGRNVVRIMRKAFFMRNQKLSKQAFFLAGLLAAGTAQADLTGITATVDTSGGDITNNETLSGSDDITVSGGNKLYLGGTGCTLTGNWIVESGTTLVSNNPICNQGTTPDDVLGSGTIYLNSGTLSTTQDGKAGINYVYERGVYNNIVVSGNSSLASVGNTEMFVWGNISGSGLITESVGYSLRLKGDNSAYTGDWNVTGDWVWAAGTNSTRAFGTGGKVTVTGGGIALESNTFEFSNDLEVIGSNNTLFKGSGTLTISGDITGTGAFNFRKSLNSSGGVDQNSPTVLKLTGNNKAFTGRWNIIGNKNPNEDTYSWHTVFTDNAGTVKETDGDSRFGTGTIYLDYGDLRATGPSAARVSNNIVISNAARFSSDGNVEMHYFGNISGSGTIERDGNYSIFLHGDNSQFSGTWNLNKDLIVAYNTGQTEKLGSGDYTFGNSTVRFNGGSVRLGVNDLVISADLELHKYDARNSTFVNGNSVTITGKISGESTKDFQMWKDATPLVKVHGNGSEFTKNWNLDVSKALKTVTLLSNNTGDKVDGADPRFGSGTIYLIGGATTSDYAARIGGSANGAMIYAPIAASGNVVFTAETGEQEVHFFGDISGSGTITDNIGYTFFLKGDNSAYAGDWYIPQDYVCVTPGMSVHVPEADRNFGSGTVYLNGGGLRTVNTSTPVTLDASIVVVSGKTAGVRYGALTFTGDVTVEGTLSSQTGDYGDPTLTFTDGGILQGTGHINGRTFVTDGGTLTAGTVGTTGTLTLDRTLEMAEGSTLHVDILSPTDYDKIVVSGDAVLSDAMEIELFIQDASLLSSGDRFDILQLGNSSTVPSLNDFASMLSPETASLFNVSYANGTLSLTLDGNAVPEPSAWLLMLFGAGFLGVAHKNRKTRKAHETH